jgi:hypothetical protein
MVWGFCYLRIFKKVQSISGRSLFKEYFVEHVLVRYIEVDCGTQRFFVMKHSYS